MAQTLRPALRNWEIQNQNSLVVTCLKIPPDPKSAHPDNLIATRHHRPTLLFIAGDVAVLQQLLDLLGFLGVRWPESLTGPPIPYNHSLLHKLRAQQMLRTITL